MIYTSPSSSDEYKNAMKIAIEFCHSIGEEHGSFINAQKVYGEYYCEYWKVIFDNVEVRVSVESGGICGYGNNAHYDTDATNHYNIRVPESMVWKRALALKSLIDKNESIKIRNIEISPIDPCWYIDGDRINNNIHFRYQGTRITVDPFTGRILSFNNDFSSPDLNVSKPCITMDDAITNVKKVHNNEKSILVDTELVYMADIDIDDDDAIPTTVLAWEVSLDDPKDRFSIYYVNALNGEVLDDVTNGYGSLSSNQDDVSSIADEITEQEIDIYRDYDKFIHYFMNTLSDNDKKRFLEHAAKSGYYQDDINFYNNLNANKSVSLLSYMFEPISPLYLDHLNSCFTDITDKKLQQKAACVLYRYGYEVGYQYLYQQMKNNDLESFVILSINNEHEARKELLRSFPILKGRSRLPYEKECKYKSILMSSFLMHNGGVLGETIQEDYKQRFNPSSVIWLAKIGDTTIVDKCIERYNDYLFYDQTGKVRYGLSILCLDHKSVPYDLSDMLLKTLLSKDINENEKSLLLDDIGMLKLSSLDFVLINFIQMYLNDNEKNSPSKFRIDIRDEHYCLISHAVKILVEINSTADNIHFALEVLKTYANQAVSAKYFIPIAASVVSSGQYNTDLDIIDHVWLENQKGLDKLKKLPDGILNQAYSIV